MGGDSSTETHKVTLGGGVLLVGGVLGRLAFYAVNLWLARLLSIEDMGIYLLCLTVMQVLMVAGSLGLEQGLLRFLPRLQGDAGEGARRLLFQVLGATGVAGLGLAVGSWLLGGGLAVRLGKPELETVVPVFALILPPMILHRVLSAFLQGQERMPATVALRFLLYPLLLLTGVGTLVTRRPALPMVALSLGLASSLAVAGVLGWLVWTRGWAREKGPAGSAGTSRGGSGEKASPGDPGRERPTFREVLAFSFPLLLTNLLGFLALWLDSLLVGGLLPPRAWALYGVAFRLSLAGVFLLEAFNGSLAPAASRLLRSGQGLQGLYTELTRLGLECYLPFLAWILVAPETLLGLFGADYQAEEARWALRILGLGQLVNVATGGAGTLLIMAGRRWLSLSNAILLLLLNGLGCLLLIPWLGLVGAACAGSMAVAAINLLRVTQVWALLGLRAWNGTFLKPLAVFCFVLGLGVVGHGPWVQLWADLRLGGFAPGPWLEGGVFLVLYSAGLLGVGLETAEQRLVSRGWAWLVRLAGGGA